MAQDVTLMGASYLDVPAVELPKTGGGIAKFTDTTPTTAEEADVTSGKVFFKSDGSQAVGTGSGGGGGGTPTPSKQINFIDYDGTILYSYTSEEWESVTSLPDNPSHDGLVAQGWNWTKLQIDEQLADIPEGPVWVGQMYVTESGDTEIDIALMDSLRLSPYLALAPKGTVEIDWGDGSTHSNVTGYSLTSRIDTQHTYSNVGDYTIKIHVVSGSFAFYGTSVYTLLHNKKPSGNLNRMYSGCVLAVRLGNNVKLDTYAFGYCYSLKYVTIPNNSTDIENYTFTNCYSLVSATIPIGATKIGNYAFSTCVSLMYTSIPNGVMSIGSNAYNNCNSLLFFTMPSSVTSMVTSYHFANCYSLRHMVMSNQITQFSTNGVQNCYSLKFINLPSSLTHIQNNVFSNCHTLSSITIPSGVTTIDSNAFSNCYGMAEYHFKPTTPPTLTASTVFTAIPSDCIIYVPAESLEAYKTAQYWSTHASKMRGE